MAKYSIYDLIKDGKYYVELKGTVDENKKAFGNIMEI